ncbi:unnamed protein product [Trichogramma brassicae]|uniref:Uncharacterized protein n=1 Tax=Trichogramma brassicae TaxID=86971 RepID=A0A6H5IX11_9HYME|nr:unnamed protein product [Trichogramma brassicae]
MKRMLICKKRESFASFAESLNFRTGSAYVWKKCKIFKNKWIDIDRSHMYVGGSRERLRQAAINKLCPPWVENDPGYMPSCTENEFLDEHFSFSELNIALEDKNEKSAPRLDGMGFDIVKKLPIKLKMILLDIFNEMYTL